MNYEGDSQPVFGHEGEAIMSDNEDTVVQETPGVHEGMMVGLSAYAVPAHPLYPKLFYDNFNIILERSRGGVPNF